MNNKEMSNNFGYYPIHYTIYNNENEKIRNQVIEILQELKGKINFNTQNRNGNTVLHLAIKTSKTIDYLHTLIENGASLLIKNNFGKTPFDYVKRHKSYALIHDKLNSSYESEKLELILKENKAQKGVKKI